MRDSWDSSAEDERRVPRVTAHYDTELGLTFHKQDSGCDSSPAYLLSDEEALPTQREVEITVLRAELLVKPHSVDQDSNELSRTRTKMFRPSETAEHIETFATVDWVLGSEILSDFSRTHTDREGHTAPEWNHVCRRQPYTGAGEQIRLHVYEDSGGTEPVLCGRATASVEDLLPPGGGASSSASGRGTLAPERELALEPPRGARGGGGSVVVQARLLQREACEDPPVTRVDPAAFEGGVERIGVSGGTASFFRLRLRQEYANGRSSGHYIGKDLSHAADEVLFYEKARSILLSPNRASDGMGVLEFMFEYAGILSCWDESGPNAKPRDLLVMQNLFDGCKKLRLLDLKIGQKTGSAGWQGKSQTAAMRQAVIDGHTNSKAEGFRLEGFDGAPQSLTTMNPLMDFGGGSEKAMKKARRMMLQRMTGAQVFLHFLDLHQEPPDPGDAALSALRSPLELAELVLRETVRRLAKLAASSRHVPTPQKWIGSSVALAFDCGRLPPRSTPEEDVCAGVKVHIFDWGRSELNTPENHRRLTPEQRQDRATFWEYYAGGVDRLAWEAARAYWHRFSNTEGWREVFFTVMDFDSHSTNDFIGRVKLGPLEECERVTVKLYDEVGSTVRGSRWGEPATLTYSVRRRNYPEGSSLAGAWLITIVKANDLPRCNWTYGTTDAFVELTAVSSNGTKQFRQVTSVKADTMSPEWHEVLELPVMAKTGVLAQQLSLSAGCLGSEPLDDMLPYESAIVRSYAGQGSIRGPDDESGFAEWTERLNRAASGKSAGSKGRATQRRPVVCSQTVRLLEQGGRLCVRLLARLAGILCCISAVELLSHSLSLQHDPEALLIAACQVFLAVPLLAFELPLAFLARHPCLDGFHNFLICCLGCLAKVKVRGLVYDFLGCIWLLVWIQTSCSRRMFLVAGLFLWFVGVLHILMCCGLLPVRIIRKVHRTPVAPRAARH